MPGYRVTEYEARRMHVNAGNRDCAMASDAWLQACRFYGRRNWSAEDLHRGQRHSALQLSRSRDDWKRRKKALHGPGNEMSPRALVTDRWRYGCMVKPLTLQTLQTGSGCCNVVQQLVLHMHRVTSSSITLILNRQCVKGVSFAVHHMRQNTAASLLIVQRFDSVLIHESFVSADEEPDL